MSAYENIPVAGGDTATPLSLRKRIALVLKHLPEGPVRFLDAGCGAGEYVRVLNVQDRVDAEGIEYLAEKVAEAKADAEIADRVQQGDLQALPFPDAHFDVALLNEVLEHVPDERQGLRELHRVLKPGGRLIIFSPNRCFPFETHGVHTKSGKSVPPYAPLIPWIPLALGQRYFDYWARNYWPHELQQMVKREGFEVLATDFIWQTFENISGHQPALIRMCKPVLRIIAGLLEKTPGLKRFGVSQVLVLVRKPD
ncbi:MAG: SAM-dependent methyltransferase [Kiritimatiellia bacterium]|jgi:SAM-dependent methyltransferase